VAADYLGLASWGGTMTIVGRSDDDPSLGQDEPVGLALARFRRERELTGSAVAQKTGISQGQISKIENLKIRPSSGDVRKITTALHLPAALAEDLVERAKRDQAYAIRDRVARRTASPAGEEIEQQQWHEEENKGTLLRVFEPILIPSLLQTSEYARRILNGFHSVQFGDDGRVWPDTAAHVALRASRQERLYDTSVIYEFVIMEQVLRYRFGEADWPVLMAAQIQRIEGACELPNVSIRILPQSAILSYPPVEAFTIVDNMVVLTESTLGGGRRDRVQEKVDLVIRAFDQFWSRSTDDVSPIFRRYKADLLGEWTQG
jgi:transcriptional regulator with XRE-family HTH domain